MCFSVLAAHLLLSYPKALSTIPNCQCSSASSCTTKNTTINTEWPTLPAVGRILVCNWQRVTDYDAENDTHKDSPEIQCGVLARSCFSRTTTGLPPAASGQEGNANCKRKSGRIRAKWVFSQSSVLTLKNKERIIPFEIGLTVSFQESLRCFDKSSLLPSAGSPPPDFKHPPPPTSFNHTKWFWPYVSPTTFTGIKANCFSFQMPSSHL